MTIKIDGKDYRCAPEVVTLIDILRAQLAEANATAQVQYERDHDAIARLRAQLAAVTAERNRALQHRFSDGLCCACRFEDDGERQTIRCARHAELEAERDAAIAERDEFITKLADTERRRALTDAVACKSLARAVRAEAERDKLLSITSHSPPQETIPEPPA